MTKKRHINQIIESLSPAIMSGQETIDSILQRYPHESEQLRPRLESISWLGKAKKSLEPRQGFITSSQKYLQQQIEILPRPNFWQRLFKKFTPQRWVFNITAPIIVVIMLALVLNSLVLTARLSIPGDPFYATKLVIEDIQLATTYDPVDKLDLYIEFSRERTTEFVELVLDGDYELLPAAANRMESELIASLNAINNVSEQNPSADEAVVGSLRKTLSNEISMLNILKSTSPVSAHPGIDLAIQVAKSGAMALH
jgi:hypothetical protein